jgi:hypothetical protein
VRTLSAAEKEIIDRYGELKRQVDAFKPTSDECDAYAKIIQSWAENEAADKALEYSGDSYTVQLKAREFARRVTSWARVFKLLGKAKFLELATITLGLIDENIPADKHKEFLIREQTGRRTLKAIAKAAPAVAPKTTRKKVAA